MKESKKAAPDPTRSGYPQNVPNKIASELEKRIGNLVSGEQKEQVLNQVKGLLVHLEHTEMYQSPLPPPEHIRVYEEFCPGCLDRILKMVEKGQQSTIDNNSKMIEHGIDDAKRGMRYGLATLILIILGATLCAILGHDWVAGCFLGVGVLGTVGRFIIGRRIKKEKK